MREYPCDWGECPYNANGGYDCRDFCGLGVSEEPDEREYSKGDDIPITETNKKLAFAIFDWCKKRDLWDGNIIYFNGKAWSSYAEWNGIQGKRIDDRLYEYESINPLDYLEFANPETLSMSFEGDLGYVLNAWSNVLRKLQSEFLDLFEAHGYYYELGNSWNLSAYEM